MSELWFAFALDLRDDALRQDLAQLDAPLVERIDVPDCALREYRMFVERDKLAQGFRCQPFGQDRIGGMVPLERAMGYLRLPWSPAASSIVSIEPVP